MLRQSTQAHKLFPRSSSTPSFHPPYIENCLEFLIHRINETLVTPSNVLCKLFGGCENSGKYGVSENGKISLFIRLRKHRRVWCELGLANHYWSRLRFSSYFISHFSFRDIGVELKCDVSRAQPMVERKSIWKSHKILNDAISLHFSAAVEQSIYLSKRNIQTRLNALHRECGAKRLRIQCWYVRRCCCGWESMLHTYRRCCWKHDLIFKVLVSIKSFTFYDFLYDDVWCHAALTHSLSTNTSTFFPTHLYLLFIVISPSLFGEFK